MVRTPCCDKSGMKKGTWTPEEDRKLMDYLTRYGCWNWRQLPRFAGLSRCGKSCRLRWMNYLRPNIKRGNYSTEEEDTIIKLHDLLGNRWSAIAAQLPGRTDNEIKNHWHTSLKKRFQQKTTTQTQEPKQTPMVDTSLFQHETIQKNLEPNPNTHHLINIDPAQILESSQSPAQPSISDELSSITQDTAAVTSSTESVLEDHVGFFEVPYIDEASGNFWTEPFLADNSYNFNINYYNDFLEDEILCSYGLYKEGDMHECFI